MKYLELFTGLAGFSKGIERAYGTTSVQGRFGQDTSTSQHFSMPRSGNERWRGNGKSSAHCVGFSEIGAVPSAILRYHYPDVRNYGNATNIVCDELPDFDFLCAGFPCQDFSIAGKRQGFNGARGTLFFEIARILSHKRPRHFLLENVKGLLSSGDGETFPTILRILSDLNYRVETVVLNSKHYGVPQNRERVFFIGHLGSGCQREILSFGDGDADFDGTCGQRNDTSHTITNDDKARGSYVVTSTLDEQMSYAIDSNYHKGSADWKGRRTVIDSAEGNRLTVDTLRTHKDEGDESFTLTAQDQHGVMIRDGRDNRSCLRAGRTPELGIIGRSIRRLTPVECARLQSFPDDWADFGMFQNKQGEWHVREISDTGKYQVFGNAVTVSVVQAIVERMLEKGCLCRTA